MSDLPRPIRRSRHRRRPSSAPLVDEETCSQTTTSSYSHQHSSSAESMSSWQVTPEPSSSSSCCSRAAVVPSSYSELAEMHAGSSVFRPATVKERRAKKITNGSFSSPAPLNLSVPGSSPASYRQHHQEVVKPWQECLTPRSASRRTPSSSSKWKGGPSTWAKRLAGRASAAAASSSTDGHSFSDAASLSPASVGTLSPSEIRRCVPAQRAAMPATLIDPLSYQSHRRTQSDASIAAPPELKLERPPTPPPKSPLTHYISAARSTAVASAEPSSEAASSSAGGWATRPSFHSTYTSGGESSSSEVRSMRSLISAPSSSAPSTPPTSFVSPTHEKSASRGLVLAESPFPISPYLAYLSSRHDDDEEKEEIDVHPDTLHLTYEASRSGGTSVGGVAGTTSITTRGDYAWRSRSASSRPQSRESSGAAAGETTSWVSSGRASPPLSAHGSVSSPRAAGFTTPPMSPSLDMAQTRRFSATFASTHPSMYASTGTSSGASGSTHSHDAHPSPQPQRSIHAMRSAAAEAVSGRSTDSDLVKDALRLAPSRQRSGSWTLVSRAAFVVEPVASPCTLAQQYAAGASCEELVTPPRLETRPRSRSRSNSALRGLLSYASASAVQHQDVKVVSLSNSGTTHISATPPKLPSPVDASPTLLFSPEALSKTLERAATPHTPAPFAFRAVAGTREPPSPSSATSSRLLSWMHH